MPICKVLFMLCSIVVSVAIRLPENTHPWVYFGKKLYNMLPLAKMFKIKIHELHFI